MNLKFDENLLVGIDEIDAQHRSIFKAFNEMLEAMVSKKGPNKFYSLVQFIEDYAISHFSLEEKYMIEYGYYDYSTHRDTHQKFLREFSTIKNKYDKEGVSSHLVISTQNWLFNWLKNHIEQIDKEFVDFLKPQIAENGNFTTEIKLPLLKDRPI
jgi:hemerythrin